MADHKSCPVPATKIQRATGPIVSPRSSSHHRIKSSAQEQASNSVLQEIKHKALHAKNFYEQIGLSNGNLPRKSDVRYRLDAPPEDTSVVKNAIPISKYGAKWIKKTPPDSTASSPSNFSYTYPYKRSGSWTDIKHKAKTPDDSTDTSQNFSNATTPVATQLPQPDTNHTNNNQVQVQETSKARNSTGKSRSSHHEKNKKSRSHPKNKPALSKKSNSCDSIQLQNEKPFILNLPQVEISPVETDLQQTTNVKENKVEDKTLASVGDLAVVMKSNSPAYSSSYENVTEIDYQDLKHDDPDEKFLTSQSLPPSTTHARKKKISADTTTEDGNITTASSCPHHSEDSKLNEVLKADILSTRLEKVKHDECSTTDVDFVDRFEKERNLKNFAHYDCQSMTFNFSRVLNAMQELKRKNVDSGASKAAAVGFPTGGSSSTESSRANSNDNLANESGESATQISSCFCNDLVASCPFFVNEVGGERDREISTSSLGTNASHLSNVTVQVGTHDGKSSIAEARNVLTNHDYLSVVEVPPTENPLPPGPPAQVSFGVERVDRGANYYRNYFYDKEHQNYMMNDDRYGPIIISLRKEKIEDSNSGGTAVHQYRIIIRTSELSVLRGSILEDALTPRRSLGHHGLGGRSCSPRDVMEHICKEIDLNELKLAQHNTKLVEDITYIDEQRIFSTYKIGVLYCRPGQTTEEEMYNNESGSAAFDEFLQLLGRKVDLQGFDKFRGGLDVKTGSTGDQSVFTEWNDYKIMFHVSTMLPFTANNPQQLLRKRHIGNDIITIVFQEPGSEPFTPKSIRSQFQHIFIIVRAVNPCTDNTCYRVAVTRAKSIPRFGPAIPEKCMFRKSAAFREFLLTKVVNGENIAHHTGKFKSLAMNTRQQYLQDAIQKYCTQQGLDSTDSKFARFPFPSRRHRERSSKSQNRPQPITTSCGAIVWPVIATDYNGTAKVHCMFGISNCAITLIEISRNKLIFSIPCLSVLGWLLPDHKPDQLHMRELSLYFGRGEKITVHTERHEDRMEIVARLERFTRGHEADTCKWRGGKTLEDMGIEINYEGIISNIPKQQLFDKSPLYSVKPSSRMVEISHTSVATLSKNDIKDLLQTTHQIFCVYIRPNDDGTPRKCSMELYHLDLVPDVISLNNHCNQTRTTPNQYSNDNDDVINSTDTKDKKSRTSPAHRRHNNQSTGKLDVAAMNDDSSATNTMSSTKSNISTRTSDSNKSFDILGTRSSEFAGQNNNNNVPPIRYITNDNISSSINSSNNRKEMARKKIMYGLAAKLQPSSPRHHGNNNYGNNHGKMVATPSPPPPPSRSFLWKAPRSSTNTTTNNNHNNITTNNGYDNKREKVTTTSPGTRQTSSYYTAVVPTCKSKSSANSRFQSSDSILYSTNSSSKHEPSNTITSNQQQDTTVVTSPTVSSSLLKSGNAAKHKRRNVTTSTVVDEKGRSGDTGVMVVNKSIYGSDKHASKQKTSKVTYRRAHTTNFNFSKEQTDNGYNNIYNQQQNHRLQPTSASAVQTPTSSDHSPYSWKQNGRNSMLIRANSEESILSSSTVNVEVTTTNKKHDKNKRHYYQPREPIDKYSKFPMPDTGSWDGLLKAAKEAEKLNSNPSASKSTYQQYEGEKKKKTDELHSAPSASRIHSKHNKRNLLHHSSKEPQQPTSSFQVTLVPKPSSVQSGRSPTDHHIPSTIAVVRPQELHRHFTKNMGGYNDDTNGESTKSSTTKSSSRSSRLHRVVPSSSS